MHNFKFSGSIMEALEDKVFEVKVGTDFWIDIIIPIEL